MPRTMVDLHRRFLAPDTSIFSLNYEGRKYIRNANGLSIYFVCDIFNNAVSISGCVASNDRMISES